MCQPVESWSAALLLVFLCVFSINAVLQHRFLKQLENGHPLRWQELGKRRVWTDDGNTSYAAAQWYLLSGEFRTLNDETLVALGVRSRRAALASIAALVLWGLFVTITQASPSFSCLLGLSP